MYARFVLNKDGTISPLMNPDLVLGLHPVLKDAQKEITETAEALERETSGPTAVHASVRRPLDMQRPAQGLDC
jgi:hypothetical protein